MPLKTNVGISRKVSDNQYGSRGASVNLDVELESTLINEPERFQDRIRQVFRLAQQAIDDELIRQQGNGATNGHAAPASCNGNGHTADNGNGYHANGNGHAATNGNGQAHNGHAATSATEKQISYARQLAKQINGLGVRRLESLAQKMFSKPIVSLTTLDASGLIDTLKAIKEGRMNLDAVLNEAA